MIKKSRINLLLKSKHSHYLLQPSFVSTAAPVSCFYCGVDSTSLLWALWGVIGGLCLCSLFIFFGALLRGQFGREQEMVSKSCQAEELEHE